MDLDQQFNSVFCEPQNAGRYDKLHGDEHLAEPFTKAQVDCQIDEWHEQDALAEKLIGLEIDAELAVKLSMTLSSAKPVTREVLCEAFADWVMSNERIRELAEDKLNEDRARGWL